MMLRIEIDGDWGLRDFAEVFFDLEASAKYFSGKEFLGYEPKIYLVDNHPVWHNELPVAPSELTVKELQFHSPGFFDLAGNEAALAATLAFLTFLIKHWSGRNMRRLSEERYSIETEKLRHEIQERFTIKDSPSPGHLNNLIGSGLMRTVADGRIKSAQMLDSKKDD